LGKELATALQPVVEGTQSAADKDGSTQALVDFIHRNRG
jgi:glucose-6-phosphate isomerase